MTLIPIWMRNDDSDTGCEGDVRLDSEVTVGEDSNGEQVNRIGVVPF